MNKPLISVIESGVVGGGVNDDIDGMIFDSSDSAAFITLITWFCSAGDKRDKSTSLIVSEKSGIVIDGSTSLTEIEFTSDCSGKLLMRPLQ